MPAADTIPTGPRVLQPAGQIQAPRTLGEGKGAIYQYLKKCTGAREGFTWAHGTSERTEGSAVSLLQNSCTVAKIEKINIEILQDMVYLSLIHI